MAWKPDNDRPTPPQGLPPEHTGYPRPAWPPSWPPPPQSYHPVDPPKKSGIATLKDWLPVLTILGTVAGWGISNWNDFKQLKKDNAERKIADEARAKADAQRDVDIAAAKDSASKARSASTDAVLKLNQVLERLNVTRNRRPRPDQ